MRSKALLAGVASLCLVGALGACGAGTGSSSDGLTGPIKIGVPQTLTGPSANLGQADQIAFQMAVDEINAKGGVTTEGASKPRKLQMSYVDDQAKPDLASSVVTKMITTDNDLMILGGDGSATCQLIAKDAQQNRTPYLMHVCLADSITQQGWNYVFRIPPPLSNGMDSLTSFLDTKVHPRSIDVIAENSVYGDGIKDGIKTWAGKAGVTFNSQSFTPGGVDYRSVLTKVKSLNPDVIVFGCYVADAITLTKQAAELQLKPKLFAGTAGFAYPQWATAVGKIGVDYFVPATSANDLKNPGLPEFVQAYQQKAGYAATYSQVAAYSSVYVAAAALEKTKLTGDLTKDRAALQKAMAGVDVSTPFGQVKFADFDGYTNQTHLSPVLQQVQQGSDGSLTWNTVWPADVASKSYVYPVPGLQN